MFCLQTPAANPPGVDPGADRTSSPRSRHADHSPREWQTSCNVVTDMTRREDEISGRVAHWLGSRIPDQWLAAPAQVEVDSEEILVLLPLADQTDPRHFREVTRGERMKVAQQAEEAFGRRVSWGTVVGDTKGLFTTVRALVAAPLAMAERRVLDSLVDAGVAADRSQAMAWCIRLVGQHEADWLQDLRDAVAATPVTSIERPFQI